VLLTGSVYLKSLLKTRKRKYGNQRNFLHKSLSEKWFTNGIHSLLLRADARGSDNILLCVRHTRYFAGQALLITLQNRSHMEYLSPTNTIIVHDVTLI